MCGKNNKNTSNYFILTLSFKIFIIKKIKSKNMIQWSNKFIDIAYPRPLLSAEATLNRLTFQFKT